MGWMPGLVKTPGDFGNEGGVQGKLRVNLWLRDGEGLWC